MGIYETIKNFTGQFEYQPEIVNAGKLARKERIIIAGMGGSRLAGDILKMWKPKEEILVHSDYNLPDISEEELKNSLIIANSYSGNTEETVDAALKALEKGLNLAIITTGGKLLEIAQTNEIPYIQLPVPGLQPRAALGYNLMALLKMTGDDDGLAEAGLLKSLGGVEPEDEGKKLAAAMAGKIPVIYTSERNMELGYIWKIIINETAKIPAFCNRFPELNHNEMIGFAAESGDLSGKFHFIFLRDDDDDDNGKIGLRMERTAELYGQKNLPVRMIELKGDSHLKKIFSSVILAHWTAYYLAQQYKTDPESVEIVENFKKTL